MMARGAALVLRGCAGSEAAIMLGRTDMPHRLSWTSTLLMCEYAASLLAFVAKHAFPHGNEATYTVVMIACVRVESPTLPSSPVLISRPPPPREVIFYSPASPLAAPPFSGRARPAYRPRSPGQSAACERAAQLSP